MCTQYEQKLVFYRPSAEYSSTLQQWAKVFFEWCWNEKKMIKKLWKVQKILVDTKRNGSLINLLSIAIHMCNDYLKKKMNEWGFARFIYKYVWGICVFSNEVCALLCLLLLYIVSLFLDKVEIYVKGFEQHVQHTY